MEHRATVSMPPRTARSKGIIAAHRVARVDRPYSALPIDNATGKTCRTTRAVVVR
jgi:hypothetical protein